MSSFSEEVKDEVKRHVNKNFTFNFVKASYDITEVKKDLRKKFIDYGYINNPENSHRIEFRFKKLKDANITLQELSICGVPCKISFKNQQNCYSVYITDADNIIKTLKVLGANSTLKFYKEVYNHNLKAKDANRLVNFETANIKRTTDASIKQLELIHRLLKKTKISNLEDDLKVVVKARLKYKMDSMDELAKKIGNITKSAINHRFIKIKKMLGE